MLLIFDSLRFFSYKFPIASRAALAAPTEPIPATVVSKMRQTGKITGLPMTTITKDPPN